MHRLFFSVALVGTVAVSAAFAFGGRSQPSSFRLGDASAACRLAGPRLVCANLLDRAGLALPRRGAPRTIAARIWWDASTPVLERWARDGLSCRVLAETILCRNASGASISVGPAQAAVTFRP